MYSQVSDNENGLEAWLVPINQKILTHQNAREIWAGNMVGFIAKWMCNLEQVAGMKERC